MILNLNSVIEFFAVSLILSGTAALSIPVDITERSQNHSEEFYLVAYKPAHDISNEVHNQVFKEKITVLEQIGSQYLVYNGSDLHSLGLDSSVDTKIYNVSGFVYKDLSLESTNIPGKYLTVNKKTNRLELTDRKSHDCFSVSRDEILLKGSSVWSVCGGGEYGFAQGNLYFGTLEENPKYCADGGTQLLLRPIGLNTVGGSIPDFPPRI
ncbi:uncharacterized protein RJT20DRAFT_43669 [Scheffersomyces xylosifermentans]|uniref:uncharacterized protein n=1 Tax=Scheffersomyces xylosifermentans TaxID=1304137 RepID=UPI00315C5D35